MVLGSMLPGEQYGPAVSDSQGRQKTRSPLAPSVGFELEYSLHSDQNRQHTATREPKTNSWVVAQAFNPSTQGEGAEAGGSL